jgi:hypothetical protein
MEITDLKRALNALVLKQTPYQTLFDYFDAKSPIMYSTKQLRDIFKNIDVDFSLNWCAVVVNSVKDKINLSGITVAGSNLDEMLGRNQLLLEADSVHEAALIAGESYYIVWPDKDGKAGGYYNDPRNVIIMYNAENPHLIDYAAKWWTDNEEHIRVTLYYPDRLEYYRSTSQNVLNANSGISIGVNSFDTFVPAGANSATPAHDLGEVPVFHFRTSQRRVVSDLANVIAPQNAINVLLSDMMVSAEFGAFKQKYIISNAEFENGKLKSAPDEVWQIPDLDAKVGEFSVTELSNYIQAIDKYATSLSIIERIPKYYLLNEGGSPSGEALIAMEAPLNKKVQDRIDAFTHTWQSVLRLMASIETGKDVKLESVIIKFDDPRTQTPLTDATILQTQKSAGFTLTQALRYQGKSDNEIKQILGPEGEYVPPKPAFVAPPTGKDSVPAK